ncbi:MAG: hypothetical protein ACI8ZM_002272 [Crocinitomix sp.]|jgi:hypothetical protein
MPLDRDLIKEKFKNGDKPNQADFARIIDSTINFTDDSVSVVDGKVGIKTTDPKATLHVYDDRPDSVTPGLGGATLMLGNQNGKNISMDANEITAKNVGAASILHLNPDGGNVTVHSNVTGNIKMIFKDTGRFGIGTLSPVGPLHIDTGTEPVVVNHSGNLGIGTTNPKALLHVYTNNTDLSEEDSVSGAVIIGNVTGKHLTIDNNEIMAKLGNVGTELYFNAEGGNVNIGSDWGAANLTHYGSIVDASDRKLKEKVKPLKAGVSEIMSLKPVSYVWKSNKDKTDVKYGFIAQDVEKVLKDITYTNKETNVKGLSTIELVPVMVHAMQEQQDHIQKLEERLAKLEKMMQKK